MRTVARVQKGAWPNGLAHTWQGGRKVAAKRFVRTGGRPFGQRVNHGRAGLRPRVPPARSFFFSNSFPGCRLAPQKGRAGRGNRTLLASLEDWNFTTKLYPRCIPILRRTGSGTSAIYQISRTRKVVSPTATGRLSLCGPAINGSFTPPTFTASTRSATIP